MVNTANKMLIYQDKTINFSKVNTILEVSASWQISTTMSSFDSVSYCPLTVAGWSRGEYLSCPDFLFHESKWEIWNSSQSIVGSEHRERVSTKMVKPSPVINEERE